MYYWIGMIAVGKVVTIWAKKKVTRQIFQTVVVAGFTGYYVHQQVKKNKNKFVEPKIKKPRRHIKL